MFIAINNTYEKHETHEQNMKNMVTQHKVTQQKQITCFLEKCDNAL